MGLRSLGVCAILHWKHRDRSRSAYALLFGDIQHFLHAAIKSALVVIRWRVLDAGILFQVMLNPQLRMIVLDELLHFQHGLRRLRLVEVETGYELVCPVVGEVHQIAG